MRSCVRSIASVACASSRPFQIVSQRTAPISRSIAVAWAMPQARTIPAIAQDTAAPGGSARSRDSRKVASVSAATGAAKPKEK
ncbi:MAG: hypothetical protein FJX69_14045 [Alphaproteobacteria bacterium]|nr:hypothetical protein [Alphaproteobacteria bacterium]MBM3626727.1 hypothetical protein [Alphaproteobacteria bacterium]